MTTGEHFDKLSFAKPLAADKPYHQSAIETLEALKEAYCSVSYDVAGNWASICFSDHGQFEAFAKAAFKEA